MHIRPIRANPRSKPDRQPCAHKHAPIHTRPARPRQVFRADRCSYPIQYFDLFLNGCYKSHIGIFIYNYVNQYNIMAKIIPAVYEDGMFKPLQKVDIPDHKHVHLILMPDEEVTLLNAQKKELSKVIGIGSSGKTDIARKHDKYLY